MVAGGGDRDFLGLADFEFKPCFHFLVGGSLVILEQKGHGCYYCHRLLIYGFVQSKTAVPLS